MAHNWTAAQESAIEAKGRDLLVSAGAGSGKTAVLTERIIRRLTDEKEPADITRMLVVTFTKAAAGELKERISAALTKALATQPKNRRLAKQLLALDRAKISTIHSFCLEVLRSAGNAAGLPSDFRIADDVEIKLLRSSIMNDLIEDYYSLGVPEYEIEGFADFADIFVGTKSDDALADIFLGIENATQSFTEHIEFIKNFADELVFDDRDFALTPCGAEILDLVKGTIGSYRAVFNNVLPEILDDEKLKKAYYTPFTSDIEFIDRVMEACQGESYSTLGEVMNTYAQPSMGIARNAVISEELKNAKELRTDFHKKRKELAQKFFSLTDKGLTKNRLDTASALNKLYTLLSAFIARFGAEKHRRSLVDYSDLERMAYSILIKDGKPTELARELGARYDEIYIDEYQDVNAVQDALFCAVSNGHNRFMVGDIKQSIYAFRGAQPKIFADYRKRFGKLTDGDTDNGAAVFLSDNFRCDKSVIDFTNMVSGCLFTSGRGDIPFTSEDLLIHSKIDSESGEPVHIVLVDGSEEDGNDDVSHREAEYIAGEIAKLLRNGKKNNGEPIKASDIAVLMRSAKAHSSVLTEVFDKYGIPYYNNISGSFFENAEVLLALCILNIIDNPTRDIYLAGALRSPVFGFTLDELIKIRNSCKDGCLYDALREYTEKNDFKKGSEFLSKLDAFRIKAEGLPVDRLLWYIYSETDLLALVYDKENAARRGNLMLLYEYARRFEGTSFKGLYNFIGYINDILEDKAQLETAKVFGESSDTVKLMNIHQSKGLEFPVCFICGTGKKFNDGDLRQNVVMERSLGISLKLSDQTGFARYDTPIRQAIVKRLADSQLEEEMRILYVAMTRARERLYVTALAKDPEALLDKAYSNASSINRYTILKNNGYIHWILTALEHYKLTNDDAPNVTVEVSAASDAPDSAEAKAAEAEGSPAPATDELMALVRERFDFIYPNTYSSKLPAKLSVSKLTPSILDDDAAELKEASDAPIFTAKRPLFLDSDRSAPTATGAERGTATHLFMQFCDFERFKDGADDIAEIIDDEAARLTEHRFITKRAASLINTSGIAKFFSGKVFSDICASHKVWREHRFNVKLPASDFTENEAQKEALKNESVLVQGVIDCFFENPDGTITVIDYKTDFVPSHMTQDEAENMLRERHRLQLMYYKAACEKISAKTVSRVAIYSFALGHEIDVL